MRKNKLSHPENTNRSFAAVLGWETIQIGFVCLFVFLVYLQESQVLSLFSTIPKPRLESAIDNFLFSLQFKFLPGEFWRLFLPLSIVSIGLIVLKRLRWYFIGIGGMLLAVLLTMDKVYFTFFSTLPSVSSLMIAKQLPDVQSSVYSVLTLTDLFNISIYLIFVVWAFFSNRFLDPGLNKNKSAFFLDKIIGVLIFLFAIHAYNTGFYITKRYVELRSEGELIISKEPIQTEGKAFAPRYRTSHKKFASTFGLFNFHLKDAVQQFMENQKKPLPQNVLKATNNFFTHKKSLNEFSSPFEGIAEGRNIFFIHLESLHPLLIDLSIDGEAVTPTLNQLADKGFYWPNMLDQISAGGSSDAEYSVLTGLMPGNKKVAAFDIVPYMDLISLPKELKFEGYHTYSFHANDVSFWNRDTNHRKLGFDKLFFKNSYDSDDTLGMGVSDRAFFKQSLNLLEKQKKPFFAFLMTLSAHHPFNDVPSAYQNLFTEIAEDDSVTERYFQLIRYTDDALGAFIQKAKEKGFWENSMFVFYGDHKPHLDDPVFEEAAGQSITSLRNHRVPLIILLPGIEKSAAMQEKNYTQTVGGLYDIFPTILHLLGKEIPCGIYGTHLFVPGDKRDAAPEFRNLNGFVYDNVFYNMTTYQPAKDEFGLIYSEPVGSPLEGKKVMDKKYSKALNAIRYHKALYNYKIQQSVCE